MARLYFIGSYAYDGTAKEPAATVTYRENVLKAGTDYAITYETNTDVGKATAVVTGIGNYDGTVTKNFTITAISLTAEMVAIEADTYEYTGAEIKPTLTVTIGKNTLKANSDYSVTYTSNTNAGKAKATVTGIGNYTGEVAREFTITVKALKDSMLKIGGDTYIYDGTAKEPAIILLDGENILNAETDYSIVYADNINVGNATVTVTGKGNYNGSITASFQIVAPEVKVEEKVITAENVKLGQVSYAFDGTAHEPVVTVTVADTVLKKDEDYSVMYAANQNIGTAYAIVIGKGAYGGIVKMEFTITENILTGEMVSLSTASVIYNGKEQKPEVAVKIGETQLVAKKDYDVEYSDNVNAGTAVVTITGRGNYAGTVTMNFTIEAVSLKTDGKISDIEALTATGEELKPDVVVTVDTVTLVIKKDYTVAYSNNVNVGTATVTVTGIGNYKDEITGTFQINLPETYKSKEGTYTLKSSKATLTTGNKTLATVNIPATISVYGKTLKVTAIADKAFYKNTNITTLKIGKNVTKIGKSAFASCTKLATTGGFLLSNNITLLVGVEDKMVQAVIDIIKEYSHSRKQVIPTNEMSFDFDTSMPLEVAVGGATIFVVDVDRFEKV